VQLGGTRPTAVSGRAAIAAAGCFFHYLKRSLKTMNRRRFGGLVAGGAAGLALARVGAAQAADTAPRKRLVVCCDGTWNDAASRTHIRWIYDQCRREDAASLAQIPEYIAGVGTGPIDTIPGGALGTGLSHNVRDAYRFIQANWKPGDEVFVFGFSRGAYTGRSLCGLMRLVGWLDDPAWVDAAYLWYRLSRTPPDSLASRVFVTPLGKLVSQRTRGQIEVAFLGVFDTVGSLGIPFRSEDLAADLHVSSMLSKLHLGVLVDAANRLETHIRRPIEGFHDTALNDHVKIAYQALAIDEHRGPFLPTLWTQVPPTSAVEQAWFAGVHGDVGGVYHDGPTGDRLAVIPLLWVLEKAIAAGLELKPEAVEDLSNQIDSLAPQHDSLTKGWETVFKVTPLNVVTRPMGNAARRRMDPTGEKFPLVETREVIHSSVRGRLKKEIEVRLADGQVERVVYEPKNDGLEDLLAH
jgi:uncharacterized protein (DUF2235 family)